MAKFWFIPLAILFGVLACCVESREHILAKSPAPHSNPAAPPPMNCDDTFSEMLPCVNYIAVGGNDKTPPSDCCQGLKKVLNNNPLCLCQAIKDAPGMGLEVDFKKAAAMPSLCHLSAPPLSNCNITIPPSPAPVAPTPAPASPKPSPPKPAPPVNPPAPTPAPPTTPPSTPPAPAPSTPSAPVSPPPSTPPTPSAPVPTTPPPTLSPPPTSNVPPPQPPSKAPSTPVEPETPAQPPKGSSSAASFVTPMSLFPFSFLVASAMFI